ncbi:hypothetical protein CDAR_168741 [Caerostris darwini]|uniref:Uncharacterized protein n=1 Tax=Caerostris darwini TaxID=1538125 RepID=A0AAV4WNP9_9ARAC|nr:hypothetical protein CDAR_168741 [Caerostris darwini]
MVRGQRTIVKVNDLSPNGVAPLSHVVRQLTLRARANRRRTRIQAPPSREEPRRLTALTAARQAHVVHKPFSKQACPCAVNAIQESSEAIISLGEQDNYTGLDVALDGHLSVSR